MGVTYSALVPAVEDAWLPYSIDFESPRGEVQVWCLSHNLFADEIGRFVEILSKDERERAASFRFSRPRNRYIIGRGVLRILVGRYLNHEPRCVRFKHGRFGKPALDPSHHNDTGLNFNLAHSGEISLFALTYGSAVGVDCEYVRQLPDADAIVARFFSKQEVSTFKAIPENQKTAAFFNCWTRKEAYLKALGFGLSMPLDSFNVSFAPDEPARLLKVDGKSGEAAKWTLKSWEPASGYVAAVACESTSPKWRFLNCSFDKWGSYDCNLTEA